MIRQMVHHTRYRTILLIGWVTVSASGFSAEHDSPPRKPPNIILLLADDLGYGETGFQGNQQIPTPALDALASGGVRFTDGYVTAPFCSASRAGMLTGRWQARFGYDFNPIGAQNDDPRAGLPVRQVTLADRLQQEGYATGLIGKWHLGGTAWYHPQRRGFDEFFGFMHEGHYFGPPPWDGLTTMLRRRVLPRGTEDRWVSPNGRLVLSDHMGHSEPDYDTNNPLLRSSQPVNETDYLTRALTREAVSFIDRHADRPFFLYLSWNAVHSPLQAPTETLRRLPDSLDIHRRIFAAMLIELDHSVAGVCAALERHGLTENTVIVFLSDNGGPTRELTSSNAPLRGEKGSLYEGGVRVPFLLIWPGQVRPGTECNTPMTSLDLWPTFLNAASQQPASADRPPEDGTDLRQFLERPEPERTIYWRVGARAAIRHGHWKAVFPSAKGNPLQQPDRWELYQLENDPAERNNVAETFPDQRDDLIRRWASWNEGNEEPYQIPRTPPGR